MLVIFRIMASVKGPLSFAKFAMNIPGLVTGFHLAHYSYTWFNQFFIKSCSQSHKAFDHFVVILSQHAWYHVPFGREVKQGEKIPGALNLPCGSYINIAELVRHRIHIQHKILKSESLGEI